MKIDTLEEYKENKNKTAETKGISFKKISRNWKHKNQKIHPGIMSFRRFEVCMMFSWILLPK